MGSINKQKKKTIITLLNLLFSVFLIFNPLFSLIVLYYGEGCPHCAKTIKLLNEKNIKYIKKEVYYNQTNQEELIKLYQKFGVPLDEEGVPTILVDKKDKKCLVIGELKESYYKKALNCEKSDNYYLYEEKSKEKEKKKEKLTLFSVIIAALVDSINPCVLAIMSLLLMNLLRQKNRRTAIIAGLLFTFTVTFIYFLMGLGVIKVFTSIGIQKTIYYILLILAIIFALLEFKAYINYKPGFLAVEMPMKFRPYAKKIIKSTTSLWFVFVSAVFLSLFLVPCSSGPYLIILGLIASQNLMKKIIGLLYLILYNLIFALPMIIITLLVGIGIKPQKINKWREKNIRRLHLIAGILMTIIVILLIYQLLAI